MLESLLNPRHDLVRQVTGSLLRQIARSPSGHLAVLSLLDGGMAQAEHVPITAPSSSSCSPTSCPPSPLLRQR